MSGSVEVIYDDSGVMQALEIQAREFTGTELRAKLGDVASVIMASTDKNFEAEGRPTRWAPLAEATLKRRRTGPKTAFGTKILQSTGVLKNSVGPNIGADYVSVGPSADYGKFHQRGTRRMPQRMFMVLQEQDIDRIVKIIAGD